MRGIFLWEMPIRYFHFCCRQYRIDCVLTCTTFANARNDPLHKFCQVVDGCTLLIYLVNISPSIILAYNDLLRCPKNTIYKIFKLLKIIINVTASLLNLSFFSRILQTDYNRHLEQLVEKTENLLTHSLKTKVSKENISQIEKYQALIERVRDLSHDDCESVTMALATSLFLQKIDELLKLLNEMKSLENSVLSEIAQIEGNLSKLKEFVEQDKCLNAGGKFEWVDSILVKCLQEGTWLLIDQVNLCSPAVLDRLNGLLEPNGVLSIGERGVDSEGNVVTIKPHENFRLFLTMDPRYGEISRAMRNRGVEIYMLNYNENPETGKLDYRSLLYNNGLTKRNHQEALMTIHKEVSEDPSNVDNLNVIQLLHSAFLVVQQLARGFPVLEAFKSSCTDVYLKARSVFHQETRMRLASIIGDNIQKFGINESDDYVLDLNAATCTLKNLQDNSKLTLLRQEGLLLDWCVQGYCVGWSAKNESAKFSLKTDLINEFFAAVADQNHIISVEVLDILPYILLNFYEHSSVSDVDFREMWAANIFQKNSNLEFLEKKNSTLAQEILAFDFEDCDLKLPWDGKHFANANNLALLLYYETLVVDDNMDRGWKVEGRQNTISLAQFSEAHRQGKMTGSNLKNQILITKYVSFLLQVKKFIDNILRYNKKVIDNSKYVALRQNLKYFNRFCDLGKMILLNKAESSQNLLKQIDEVGLLLKVHYKWLKKFIRFLEDNYEGHKLNTDYKKESDLVKALMNEIDNSLMSVYDPFRKICKIYKKHINSPLPCSSDIVLKTCSSLQEITNSFSTSRNKYIKANSLSNEPKFITLQTDEALNIRSELINLWHNIYANEVLDENVSETLQNMTDFCATYLNITETPKESEVRAPSPKDIVKMTTKIQLWPIHEYMFTLFVESFRRKLCEKLTEEGDNVSLPSTYLSSHHSCLPNIPAELLAILNTICTKQDDPQERNRLLFALSIWFSKFTENSYAIKHFKQVSHWRSISSDQKDDSAYLPEISDRENLTSGPVLVSLISELILNTSQSTNPEKSAIVTGATLGSYSARLEQLKTLNDTLWKNSVALNSLQFNHTSNDLITLRCLLKEFLACCDRVEADSSLKQSIESEKLPPSVKSTVSKEYLQPLEDLRSISETLTTETSSLNRGKTWTLLGYLQAFVFGNMSYIDPVYKVAIKLRYVEEDVNDCENTLYVAKLYSRILGLLDNHIAHPRFHAIEANLEQLKEEKDSLQKLKAVRPANAEFIALSKEFTNFRTALGSYAIVDKHVQKLIETTTNLKNEVNESNIQSARSTKREAEIWLESMRRFMDQIESRFLSGYPDIVYPILAGLAQMRHGIRILIDESSRLVAVAESKFDSEKLGSFIRDLVRFPTIGPKQENLLSLVELCTSHESRELLSVNMKTENTFVTLQEQFRLTIAGLYEFYNYIVLKGNLTKDLWVQLNNLLQQIVLIWRQQQTEMEKREAEKDSLYKNRVKVKGESLTEEEQIAQELKSLFPTHREDDFADVDSSLVPTLEKKVTVESKVEDFGALITENDIKEVQNIHSSIIKSFTSSEWLLKNANESRPDFIEPLLQRYNTFGLLLDRVAPALNHKLTSELYTSLNVLTQLVARLGQGETLNPESCIKTAKKSSKLYDYYKDSNVEEVKQCVPLLERISNKITELLNEWPEHPTLVSIRIILHRIYSFPVTSAVSRFLTGLEMLLVKMHEWEENAHSGVSLTEFILSLTQQIISWRKLELACWKDCLITAQLRLRSQTSKWWFFLYDLFESYVSKNPSSENPKEDAITTKKLIESLEIFMRESSFAQFEARLELLLTFHCHTYYLNPSVERDNALAISWNIYNYYSQFLPDINNRISAIKAPIEKKLKDFVKIARWNDISYWSVKETVEKTHRTLHKHIKEYETGLKDVVTPFLVVKPTYKSEAGIWDKPKADHDSSVDPNDYLAPTPKLIITDVTIKSDLISRVDSHYLSRAKKLCKEAILTSMYPGLRMSLEEFIEEFMSHSARLRALEIDRTQLQPKQKSQAKNILQQKRMALADYFKTLQGFGVSHRIGVLAWKNRLDEVLDFTIPPIELRTSFNSAGSGIIEKKTLEQWEGCERYYYNSLIKLNALDQALLSNKTDLGPQNMEWCKGFSAHLMLLANKQKKVLASVLKYFVRVRSQVLNLSKINIDDLAITKQKDLWHSAINLKELLITSRTILEQFLVYLQACPTESQIEGDDYSYNLDTNDLPIVNCKRGDELWEKTNTYVKECLIGIADLSKKFNSTFSELDIINEENPTDDVQASIMTSKHFAFLKDNFGSLKNIREKINQFAAIFDAVEDGKHPLLENITFLERNMANQLDQFEKINTHVNEQSESESPPEKEVLDKCESDFEKLVSSILLVIQNKYKDNLATAIEKDDKNESEREKEEEDTEDEYEKNKLREKLVESIEKDIATLKLKEIYEILDGLLRIILNGDSKVIQSGCRLLQKCLPLLQQYLLLAQFYLNEQVASLRITCKILHMQLNVFLDLATNGFCVPKDLDLEEGDEGSEEKTGKGGMGLGDGEGEKDVSEQIETEDQLEDAKPAGQEKEKPEDKECPEEDNGIEMSEDFEGQLQDVEPKEDEDGNKDEEDDEDIDKQMGDTADGSDKLDEQIWGDDEDEPESEETEKKDDEIGDGEKTGEKEFGAKDERTTEDSDEKGNDDQDEERKEEQKEINEMEEPEYDEDQVNPYHGKHQPEPEPEPLDLPEEMNMDDEDDAKDEEPNNEENPFDIDKMKEAMPPPEVEEMETAEEEVQEDKDTKNQDSSDEEDANDPEKPADKAEQEDGANEDENEEESAQKAPDAGKENPEEEETKSEEKEQEPEEKALPSTDEASKEMDAAEQADQQEGGSRDQVANQAENEPDQKEESSAENWQDEKKDKGTGQSQAEQHDSGHSGSSAEKTQPTTNQENEAQQNEKRKNPGKSDEDHTLAEKIEPDKKKLRTMIHSKDKAPEDDNNEEGAEQEEEGDPDICQHVKEKEKFDHYAVDAATEEQSKEQASNMEQEKEPPKDEEEAMDVDMHEDEEVEMEEEPASKQNSEKVSTDDKSKDKKDSKEKGRTEDGQLETVVDVEGETTETMTVQRGAESAFFTNLTEVENELLSTKWIEKQRMEVEKMLSQWTEVPTTEEAVAAWNSLSAVTDAPARDLSEKLRLVLEPTQASRLKGDYRTGRRINMRKIIPYIASQFRKDKIWLRRTKPSKRDYQIVLAIDDSSSMADNHSKELAFESLSLISKAMTYLEAGQLSVLSFGEEINVLHPLGETFSEHSGSRLVQKMRFEQKKTMVGELVNFTVDMFQSQSNSTDNAKLLVVLSDGRGIFSEGTEKVNLAVRRARLADIFLVFIIVDNPLNKDSILDIRMPVFQGGKLIAINSYMDSFPFPFYMILRDINALPGVLSDALRQWFEVVGKIDT
ncbi:hypothetical protein TSAR_006385 [Trichomalopsis sarcophagae]|uniref:VWFA domain-containing protein n=1 Tax=Trichomalopsis sarcophagae TaxID=543379 RepID=A0A232F2P2_9HYME|nr:hypothetical protein TSAR_006385 [Trichomalopsis sarcophagae]